MSIRQPELLVEHEGIRQRAEVTRIRGQDVEVIELPALAKYAPVISQTEDNGDVEVGTSAVALARPVSAIEVTDNGNTTMPPGPDAQQRRQGWLHFAALCYTFFLAGWNDSSTGPLLPTIQRYYGVGFTVVSMLFVLYTVGFIIGAVVNVQLMDKYAFGKLLVVGSACQLICYALLAAAVPFPVMCIAFGIAGFGLSSQITLSNGFMGSVQHNPTTKLSFMQAFYGLGAFCAPLVATQFSTQKHWSFHYLVSAGLAVVNIGQLIYIFRFKSADTLRVDAGETLPEQTSATTSDNKFKQVMSIPAVHCLAFWTLIYVGVEVTLGGWIVTFIQQNRHGGASAGYVSSGFWGGLTLGRVVLLWLNKMIGEHRVIFVYAISAIALQITIWKIPSLLENAIAISFIGLLLGPMYPILIHHSSVILPRWLYINCIGWIGGLGQTGSAILPFITGLLVSKFGTWSLQPFVVSMMSTMIVLWAFVPRVRKID